MDRKLESPSPYHKKLSEIFMGHYNFYRDRVKNCEGRFVHYTSAENGIKIIRGKQVWLRNTLCMNDFMEIEHGFSQMLDFLNSSRGDFKKNLDACHEGIFEKAASKFDEKFYYIKTESYIACMSEHDVDEDELGRLSMWRSYGGSSGGVAIVLKNEAFLDEGEKHFNLFVAPVLYLNTNEFHKMMSNISESIINNRDFLKRVPEEVVVDYLFFFICVDRFNIEASWI